MGSDGVEGLFSRDVIALTTATCFLGMTKFEDHEFQQPLAEIFCFAVRFALLDELEEKTSTPAEVLKSVVDHLDPNTPQEIVKAFSALAPSEFEASYKHIRVMAGTEGVDIEEFARALTRAKAITK